MRSQNGAKPMQNQNSWNEVPLFIEINLQEVKAWSWFTNFDGRIQKFILSKDSPRFILTKYRAFRGPNLCLAKKTCCWVILPTTTWLDRVLSLLLDLSLHFPTNWWAVHWLACTYTTCVLTGLKSSITSSIARRETDQNLRAGKSA